MSSKQLIEHYVNELRGVFQAKKWIVAMNLVVPATKIGKQIKLLGAEDVLAIGGTRGTGEIPEDISHINLELPSYGGMMEAIHGAEKALMHLSPEILQQIEAFDPLRQTKVIRTLFSECAPLAGRPTFGKRTVQWQALEDKMIIDSLWDTIGIPRAESVILSLQKTKDIQQANSLLDQGMGTVWVGDNRDGWHGGATRLRWVRSPIEYENALQFLRMHCDQIRIMPFLDGLPCSIHGWVFPNKTIALRPCEMLVFRQPNSSVMVYSGAATSWKPPRDVEQHMRNITIQVGDHLRDTIAYKGSFTIDGIVTQNGFFPTELNPRFGGALGRMAQSIPELPLYLLHLSCAEGIELDYRPQELEQLLINEVDRNPVIKGMYILKGRFDLNERQIWMQQSADGKWYEVNESSDAAKIELGPAPEGSLLFAIIPISIIGYGRCAAPALCSIFRSIGIKWGLNIPDLQAAPEYSITTC
jgi:hypothetical protein